MTNEDVVEQIMEDRRIVHEYGADIKLVFDSSAPQEVRMYCDWYDPKYGCLRGIRCCNDRCQYYKKVIVLVAQLEGVGKRVLKRLTRIKRVSVNRCRDCGEPVSKRKRYCPACSKKRRSKAQKTYQKRKETHED